MSKVQPLGRDHAIRTPNEILDDAEKAKGKVSPTDTLFLCVMLRAHERTLKAQRELIQKLGLENSELKKQARNS